MSTWTGWTRRSKTTLGYYEFRVSLSRPLTNIRAVASEIDYYGVTFDQLVPTDEYFPEVL
jgi:hypothetical protein